MAFAFPFADKFGKGTDDLLRKKVYTKDKTFEVSRNAGVLNSTTTIDVGSDQWKGDLEVETAVQGVGLTGFASTNNQKSFKASFAAAVDTDVDIELGNTNDKRPSENHFTATVAHTTKLYAGRLKVDRINNKADGLEGTFFSLGGVASADAFALGAELKGDTEDPSNTDKFDITYGLTYKEAGFEAFAKSVSTKKRYENDDKDANKDEYVCGLSQQVDDQYTFGVQITFDAAEEKKKKTVLVLGGQYKVDASTTIKAKVDSNSTGAFAIQQKISNGTVELAAEFDKQGSITSHGFAIKLGE